MKAVIRILAVVLALSMCMTTVGIASEGGAKAAPYEDGKDEFYEGHYADAAECFALAGDYKDARQWKMYCDAFVALYTVGDCAQAVKLFRLLAEYSFEEAQAWTSYAEGRLWQRQKSYYAARDCFRAAGFIGDSIELYTAIDNWITIGAPYPEPVYDGPVPPVTPKTGRSGTLTKDMEVYLGPGTEYRKFDVFIPKNTEILIFEKEKSSGTEWALFSFTYKDALYQAYVNAIRVHVTDTIPENKSQKRACYLKETYTPRFGPSEAYATWGISLPKDQKALFVEQDGVYAMIEVDIKSKTARMWVEINNLTFYE